MMRLVLAGRAEPLYLSPVSSALLAWNPLPSFQTQHLLIPEHLYVREHLLGTLMGASWRANMDAHLLKYTSCC